LGIGVGTLWINRRDTVFQPSENIPVVALHPDEREGVIEIVFRDMMQRHETHTTYFLSFGPDDDPPDSIMVRFNESSVTVKKLSQAVRNGPQLIDQETGEIGVNLMFGSYTAVNQNEVVVGTRWEYWKRVGRKPEGEFKPYEYRLRKVGGTWKIETVKFEPPIV
jgi:hypothetical protein